MSELKDGTNPYGRLLKLMQTTAADELPEGIVKGEYLGKGKFSIGAHTFERKEVVLIQNEIIIDGETFKLPGLEKQKHTIERTVNTYYGEKTIKIEVSVPVLKAGDAIIAYQFGDEEYVILGKVV